MLVQVMRIVAILTTIICLGISVSRFFKAFGYYEYDTEEERKQYKDWLEREGTYRGIMAIIVTIILTIGLIWIVKIEFF